MVVVPGTVEAEALGFVWARSDIESTQGKRAKAISKGRTIKERLAARASGKIQKLLLNIRHWANAVTTRGDDNHCSPLGKV
jgi:hypothetical protein